MKNKVKGSLIKNWQIGSILRQVYKNPGVLRVDLSEKLNINRSITTNYLNFLIKNNWLLEDAPNGLSIPVRLNTARIFTAGLSLQPVTQELVVCNAAGEIVHQFQWNDDLENIQDFIENTVQKYVYALPQKILALGIAIPGIVDREKARLLSSNPLAIADALDLPDAQGEIPLFYENDIRSVAWGILAYREEKDNFLVHFSDFQGYDKIGKKYERIVANTAFSLRGKIYAGKQFCSAETRALIRNSNGHSGVPYIRYHDKLHFREDVKCLDTIVNEYALQTSFVSNYLDVEKIYFCGDLEYYKDLVERSFRYYQVKNSKFPDLQQPEVIYMKKKDLPVAAGAAGYVLEMLFQEPDFMQESSFYGKVFSNQIEI